MATIIITIILNLLIGTPTEGEKEIPKETTGTELDDSGTMTTMGGSGAWTNVDK